MKCSAPSSRGAPLLGIGRALATAAVYTGVAAAIALFLVSRKGCDRMTAVLRAYHHGPGHDGWFPFFPLVALSFLGLCIAVFLLVGRRWPRSDRRSGTPCSPSATPGARSTSPSTAAGTRSCEARPEAAPALRCLGGGSSTRRVAPVPERCAVAAWHASGILMPWHECV